MFGIGLQPKESLKKWMKIHLLISFFVLAVTTIALAEPSEPITHQELVLEQQRLAVLNQSNLLRQIRINHLKERIQTLKSSDEIISAQQLRRVRMDLSIAKTDLVTTQNELNSANKNLKLIQSTLKKLDEQLSESKIAPAEVNKIANTEIIDLTVELEYQTNLLKLKQEEIRELTRSVTLLANMVELEARLLEEMEVHYQRQVREARSKALFQVTQEVQSEQQKLLNQLAILNQQAQQLENKNETTSPQAIKINLEIFQLQQTIDYSQLKLKLADISARVDSLFDDVGLKSASFNELTAQNRYANNLLTELSNLKNFITKKIFLIEERKMIESESYSQGMIDIEQLQDHRQVLNDLLKDYKKDKRVVGFLIDRVRAYQKQISQQLNNALKQRRVLPSPLNIQAWLKLAKNSLQIPVLVERYIVVMFDSLSEKIAKFDVLNWIVLVVFESLVLFAWLFGKKYFETIPQQIIETKKQRVTLTLAYVVMELLKRNWTAILIVTAFSVLLFTASMPFHSYQLLFYLVCFWFGYRFVTEIARLLLLENTSDISGADVNLYHRLKWLFRIGAVLVALTMLAYQLPVVFEVRNLLIRTCMLLLLLFSWIMWKGREVIPNLMKLYIHSLPNYFLRITRLLCLLIPIVFFSSALVGLLGYMTLAWQISFYQIVFLFVFATYVVLRGAWGDLMDFVYDASIRYLKNGWLWCEAILKPLDHVMRFGLILFAFTMLFVASGFASNAQLIEKISRFLITPLFNLMGTQITPKAIIETLIVIAIIFWASRWSREFAYRSLFSRISDKGLRNSMAVFTQYTTVIVGILIILRVLGIDVTGFSVILGGLAVGIGFGLRDFANNFVSGVLLLIERPLRVGDTVSIAGFEGEVIHIGMRSLVVKTWDHMDVVIPNSETFSKSFTNWTRQDNIVRSVISIKISREDNPLKIQELIYQILKQIPEVLSEPSAEVFMKEIGDSLIEFEIRYYIHFTANINRSHVRSKVLFEIWKKFEELGIKPPYPSQEIYLKSLPSQVSKEI